MKTIIVVFLTSLLTYQPGAAQQYTDYEETESILNKIHNDFRDITALESVARTPGGNDIWVLTVGRGDRDNHPGMAVIGGVDGRYISGPSLTIGFAERLLRGIESDSISNLLDSLTFYIIPNVSPDATDQFFAPLKYERCANDRPSDDDRDGRIDEDPYEDLNGDGLITFVRIKDPSGEWIQHADDPRVMVKADRKKGEKGEYIVITEGIDNDLDNHFNEDGAGGTCFNRNLPFGYDHFKAGAGEFPVSEPESTGVLDFLYEKWNIFSVFTFGPADNLAAPFAYNEQAATGKIISGMQEKDVTLNTMVSEKYNEYTGKKQRAELKVFGGGFLQWAYFHYGRQSYGTPGFYIPEIKSPADTLKTILEKEQFNEEVNFLRWADSLLTEPGFVSWEKIEHPDFPGKEAEVGGIFPFQLKNPPAPMLDSLAENHSRFIIWLAGLRPRIEMLNLKTTDLGNQLYRLEFDVYNRGIFPAMSGIGEKTRWVKKPKISLNSCEDQEILSGKKITLLDNLDGDTSIHFSWLIRGKGNVSVEVGCPQTGYFTESIDLN